jgi:hypothetical protein
MPTVWLVAILLVLAGNLSVLVAWVFFRQPGAPLIARDFSPWRAGRYFRPRGLALYALGLAVLFAGLAVMLYCIREWL